MNFSPLSQLATLLAISTLLTSCNPFKSGPSEAELEAVFGYTMHDAACVEAQGKPGYMCTFITDGNNWSITRRLIKTESGWQAVAGN